LPQRKFSHRFLVVHDGAIAAAKRNLNRTKRNLNRTDIESVKWF